MASTPPVDLSDLIVAGQAYGDARVVEATAPLLAQVIALQAEIVLLKAEIELLKSQIPTPPVLPGLLIGAAANIPNASVGTFNAVNTKMGGALQAWRHFSSSLPASAGSAPSGVSHFFSFKGDPVELAKGVHDAAVTTLAKSMPPGSDLTSWHEPEDNMAAATFVALQDHLYGVVKAANPQVNFGPAYMSYWWKNAKAIGKVSPSSMDSWLPPKFDFLAVDNYNIVPKPLEKDPQWLNWFTWALKNCGDKPIIVAEYGPGAIPPGGMPAAEQAAMEKQRALNIEADFAYLAKYPQVKKLLFWFGTGSHGDWSLHDAAGMAALKKGAVAGKSKA